MNKLFITSTKGFRTVMIEGEYSTLPKESNSPICKLCANTNAWFTSIIRHFSGTFAQNGWKEAKIVVPLHRLQEIISFKVKDLDNRHKGISYKKVKDLEKSDLGLVNN